MSDRAPTTPTTDERFDRLAVRVAGWVSETFPDQTAETVTSHLVAEVGELLDRQDPIEAADCAILLLSWLNRMLLAPGGFRAELREELAVKLRLDAEDLHDHQDPSTAVSLMTSVLAWCALHGLTFADLLTLMEHKHTVNQGRTWRLGERGYHEHVRE